MSVNGTDRLRFKSHSNNEIMIRRKNGINLRFITEIKKSVI